MSTSTLPAPAGTTPSDITPPPAFEALPGELREYTDEMRAFYHALPVLLADEDVGQYAVVGGGQVHGTWDTYRDARQFGRRLFPDGRFLTQRVDRRFLDVLPRYFGALPGLEDD